MTYTHEKVNVSIVKELYASWDSEANFEQEYVVKMRGVEVNFSYHLINTLMKFLENSPHVFEDFYRRPEHKLLCKVVCGPKSNALRERDPRGYHNFYLRTHISQKAKVLLR